MSRVIDGARKFVILKTIRALDEGWRSHNGTKQPATLSNLSALMIKKNMLPGYFDRWSHFELSDPIDDEPLTDNKRVCYITLRQTWGGGSIGKDSVDKTRDNHVLVREDRERPWSNVTAYTRVSKTDSQIDSMSERFDVKRQRARGVDDVTQETIRFPEKTGYEWKIVEAEIPRIKDGECIDTGVSVRS